MRLGLALTHTILLSGDGEGAMIEARGCKFTITSCTVMKSVDPEAVKGQTVGSAIYYVWCWCGYKEPGR